MKIGNVEKPSLPLVAGNKEIRKVGSERNRCNRVTPDSLLNFVRLFSPVKFYLLKWIRGRI